jgi:hypothetical protein
VSLIFTSHPAAHVTVSLPPLYFSPAPSRKGGYEYQSFVAKKKKKNWILFFLLLSQGAVSCVWVDFFLFVLFKRKE